MARKSPSDSPVVALAWTYARSKLDELATFRPPSNGHLATMLLGNMREALHRTRQLEAMAQSKDARALVRIYMVTGSRESNLPDRGLLGFYKTRFEQMDPAIRQYALESLYEGARDMGTPAAIEAVDWSRERLRPSDDVVATTYSRLSRFARAANDPVGARAYSQRFAMTASDGLLRAAQSPEGRFYADVRGELSDLGLQPETLPASQELVDKLVGVSPPLGDEGELVALKNLWMGGGTPAQVLYDDVQRTPSIASFYGRQIQSGIKVRDALLARHQARLADRQALVDRGSDQNLDQIRHDDPQRHQRIMATAHRVWSGTALANALFPPVQPGSTGMVDPAFLEEVRVSGMAALQRAAQDAGTSTKSPKIDPNQTALPDGVSEHISGWVMHTQAVLSTYGSRQEQQSAGLVGRGVPTRMAAKFMPRSQALAGPYVSP